MHIIDRISRLTLVALVVVLGTIVLKSHLTQPTAVSADTGRFDYVQIVAAPYIYNGAQGILVLDKRNGNVWFIQRAQDMKSASFKDPVFVIRVPLEKLDEQVR